MGQLIYGSMCVGLDDRVLAHLQIVVINKLRRQESFAVSWRDSNEVGDGRSAIWIDPSISLYFRFDESRFPDIDREWIALLSDSADSSTGLILTGPDGEAVTASPEIGIAFGTRRGNGGARGHRQR